MIELITTIESLTLLIVKYKLSEISPTNTFPSGKLGGDTSIGWGGAIPSIKISSTYQPG